MKEASFNNSFKENEEQHRDEAEILVTKVEEAKGRYTYDVHKILEFFSPLPLFVRKM